MKATLFILLLGCLTATAQEVRPLTIIPTGHVTAVSSLSISPDGKYLLSCGHDDLAILWDMQTGTPLYDFVNYNAHSNEVAVFSPDGKNILTGGSTPSGIGVIATIWDIQTKKIVREIRSEQAYADYIDYSSDGSLIATTGVNGLVQIWEAATGTLKSSFKTSLGKGSIHFSADNKNIILPRYGPNVYDAATGKEVGVVKDKISTYVYTCPSPDGKYILYAGGEYVTLYDSRNLEFVRRLPAFKNNISSIDYAPDSRSVVIGCDDGTATCWDMGTGKLIRTFSSGIPIEDNYDEVKKCFKGVSGQVKAVKYSPDGKTLFVGLGNRSILQYELATGKLLKTFRGPNMVMEYVYFDDAKKALYVRELGTKVMKRLQVTTGEVDNPVGLDQMFFEGAIALPSKKYELAMLTRQRVDFYDVAEKKTIATLYFLGDKEWYFSYRFGQAFDVSKNGMDYIFTIQGLQTNPLKKEGNPKYKPGLLASMFK